MTIHLTARSISRPAADTLQHTPFAARVLATFEQACDLVAPNGDVVAVVTPCIGDGPLNVVVKADPGELAAALPGAPACSNGDTLHIGNLEVALEEASIWEPCPDWSALRARQQAIITNLPALRAIALSQAPADSLLATSGTINYVILNKAKDIRSGWTGDVTHLQNAAAHLAGLGIGLTPAGDDFLAGVMLWAWLAHPAPGPLCHTLAEAAASRTTTLSAALLRAAARGECDVNWHQLLTALGAGSTARLAPAVRRVVAHGATSGADMLAGFLWLTDD